MEEVRIKYKAAPIPQPTAWSGYRLVPSSIEFLDLSVPGGERVRYDRTGTGIDDWKFQYLAL